MTRGWTLFQPSQKGCFVIVVSEDQLAQVEYLLDQARQGNHVLFDAERVRTVFAASATAQALADSEAYEVEPHLERVITLPTLAQKRAYLERLDTPTFSAVVKTYFAIVENNLREERKAAEVTH